MSNLYRSSSGFGRRSPSRFFFVVRAVIICALVIGIFVLAVKWFRHDTNGEEGDASVIEQVDGAAVSRDENKEANSALTATTNISSTITLIPVNGSASGTATFDHVSEQYTMTIIATLLAIDPALTSYEVWFVKPGITDFFSLGKLYSREDGAWGLVWQQTDALVRSDIAAFNKIIVTREPVDGNPAPSPEQVLVGEFK